MQDQQQDEGGTKSKPVSSFLGGAVAFLLFLFILLLAKPTDLFGLNLQERSPGVWAQSAPPRNLTVLSPFFQPLSPKTWRRLSHLQNSEQRPLLLCASSSCLKGARSISFPAKQLVLPPLCKGSPLQPFIVHHAFYKIILEKEFPRVFQLVTSLCILYQGPSVLINPNMGADFSKLLRESRAPRTKPTLIFSRRREVVFGESYTTNCPDVESLMREVMNSLDSLPVTTSNNPPIVGTAQLFKISTFWEKFEILDIDGDNLVVVDEEPGVIHYDTFQTDCRKGEEDKDKNCIVNAGNEMQVATKHSSVYRCCNVL